MRNIKIILEYDGTGFMGFQKQSRTDRPTIQDTLEQVLKRVCGEAIKTSCAGRTDTGVHALGQVVSFKTESALPLRDLKRAMNALLPDAIAVREMEEVEIDFHARFSAKCRYYNYYILNSETRSPLGRAYFHHRRKQLDIELMREAVQWLVGEKDFTSFSCSLTETDTPIRRIDYIRITKGFDLPGDSSFPVPVSGILPALIVIELRGNGFLHSMVRFIVATLIKVGEGRMTSEDVKKILDAKKPGLMSTIAPACGLFLMKVEY